MDKFLIYTSYETYDYNNYYHLALNGEFIYRNQTDENLDDVIKEITEKEKNETNFELYIVQEVDVYDWDYEEKLRENNIVMISENCSETPETLCRLLEDLLEEEFSVYEEEECLNKKSVKILYAGNCRIKGSNYDEMDTLKKAEAILKSGGEEMTELARIIKEKYERMNNNEQF